jgi:hypothetical protein
MAFVETHQLQLLQAAGILFAFSLTSCFGQSFGKSLLLAMVLTYS